MQSNSIVNQKEYEVNKAFNEWWDGDDLTKDNPFAKDTPAYWAWEGWVAGVKAEREAMQANGWRQCAVGQRTTQFCGQVEQAVVAEREACAKVCESGLILANYGQVAAKAIRARGEK